MHAPKLEAWLSLKTHPANVLVTALVEERLRTRTFPMNAQFSASMKTVDLKLIAAFFSELAEVLQPTTRQFRSNRDTSEPQ